MWMNPGSEVVSAAAVLLAVACAGAAGAAVVSPFDARHAASPRLKWDALSLFAVLLQSATICPSLPQA